MEFKEHNISGELIGELISENLIINKVDDALDIIGNASYLGFERVLIYERNFNPRFFDLKTKLAGDILQKFTQYRVALTIIGDFEKYESKALQDFIRESNKGKQVNFKKTINHL